MPRVSFAILLLLAAAPAARAERSCFVADPSGTPLNVRVAPQGRILGALHNGAAVRLIETSVDESGRPWAYVEPRVGPAGWVFRGFIDCR
jgi:hypothetical protein